VFISSQFQLPETVKKRLSILFRLSLVYGFTSYFAAIIKYEIRQMRRRLVAQGSTTSSSTGESSLPIHLPPPQSPTVLVSYPSLPISKDHCPLCHNKRLHPVASSSGYVFCFRCLVMYMRMHGPRCPVTGLACTESNLIRLYEPSTSNVSSPTNT
jgi:hypothetical protein